jgi:hypothetical protein
VFLKNPPYLSRMIRKDALWKGIIETLSRDFIAFFYPALYNQMDKRRDPDFLDKELAALQQPSASRMRLQISF